MVKIGESEQKCGIFLHHDFCLELPLLSQFDAIRQNLPSDVRDAYHQRVYKKQQYLKFSFQILNDHAWKAIVWKVKFWSVRYILGAIKKVSKDYP